MKSLLCIKVLFGVTVIFITNVKSECTEEENHYQCEGGQKCIPVEWLCDRAHDCAKGDDEYHVKCGSREDRGECEAFHFECIDPHSKRKKCVRFEWKCDGSIDCENAVDEVNCEPQQSGPLELLPGLSSPRPSSLPKNISKNDDCKSDEFKCYKSNECIERDKVCDDKKDCKDGSDESVERCSMPPIIPLIQPNSKQIQSIENKPVSENSTEMKGIKTTTAMPLLKELTLETFNHQNAKIDKIEKVTTFTTTVTTMQPKFDTKTTSQQQIAPLNVQNVAGAMINPIPQIKPIQFFTNQPPDNTKFQVTTTAKTETLTLKPIKSVSSLMEKLNPTTLKSIHEKETQKLIQENEIPNLRNPTRTTIVSSEKTTSPKPPFLITYKMSAEAMKEKAKHFSVISQSNVISSSSSIENIEPIHPEIGTPIIPVNRFQILVPLSALQKENHLSSSTKTMATTTPKNTKEKTTAATVS